MIQVSARNKKRLTDHVKAINELRENVQTLAKEFTKLITNEVHNHISETIGKSKTVRPMTSLPDSEGPLSRTVRAPVCRLDALRV